MVVVQREGVELGKNGWVKSQDMVLVPLSRGHDSFS
jgi:hypothetical protein